MPFPLIPFPAGKLFPGFCRSPGTCHLVTYQGGNFSIPIFLLVWKTILVVKITRGTCSGRFTRWIVSNGASASAISRLCQVIARMYFAKSKQCSMLNTAVSPTGSNGWNGDGLLTSPVFRGWLLLRIVRIKSAWWISPSLSQI